MWQLSQSERPASIQGSERFRGVVSDRTKERRAMETVLCQEKSELKLVLQPIPALDSKRRVAKS